MNILKKSIYVFVGLLISVSAFAEKRVVVFGIDETGSYSFRNKAISIANRIISDLQPGDIFYARRITEKSYIDSCTIFRLEIPEIGTPPKNKFDKRARYSWNKKLRKMSLLKTRAVNILTKLRPVKAPKTDIWGFIAAAADRIHAEYGSDSRLVVIITSDMKDNCHRETTLDLKGAEVMIAGFESGENPKRAQKIKADWIKSLKRCNASSIKFLPPDFNVIIAKAGGK